VSDTTSPAPGAALLQTLDDAKISRFQIKTMFVSGMGFFTDAYDLFVIGIVVSLLKTQWTMSTNQVSWLNSATLLASAFGAIIFGRVADMLGRKRIYGYEVLILAAGAIASAFSPNYTFLLVSRIVLGVGIGGDYPVSATIMSEYSGLGSVSQRCAAAARCPVVLVKQEEDAPG
jgi:MFS transporter, PHS family, inorganic phosphate transporter